MEYFKQQMFVVSPCYVQGLWRGCSKMPQTFWTPNLEDIFAVKDDYARQDLLYF